MTSAQIFDALFDCGSCKCTPKDLDVFMLTHHSIDNYGLMTVVKNATPVKNAVKYKKIAPNILSVWIEGISKK